MKLYTIRFWDTVQWQYVTVKVIAETFEQACGYIENATRYTGTDHECSVYYPSAHYSKWVYSQEHILDLTSGTIIETE